MVSTENFTPVQSVKHVDIKGLIGLVALSNLAIFTKI